MIQRSTNERQLLHTNLLELGTDVAVALDVESVIADKVVPERITEAVTEAVTEAARRLADDPPFCDECGGAWAKYHDPATGLNGCADCTSERVLHRCIEVGSW